MERMQRRSMENPPLSWVAACWLPITGRLPTQWLRLPTINRSGNKERVFSDSMMLDQSESDRIVRCDYQHLGC